MYHTSKNTEKISDSILWAQLIADDQNAFSMLFEKYLSPLVNYGKTLMPSHEKVKDCVQDVFVDIWLYRHSLSEDVVVKAYLFSSVRKRIARLYERDRIFRQTTSLEDLEFSVRFSIEHQLITDETMELEVQQLNQLLNALPPRQKETLYLRYHQGLSLEQIAEILDINHQSVKNLLQRAILHLRKEWKGTISLLLMFSFVTS
ncbi:RNA polymerase sigma factor [Runella zeae]|uniref:RNA polymerase sigma factor n=1 Tax=Runella zeae TaxID=94255 RepID=UPI00042A133A|nr:sigma-70 family RNA polymerase sigma factor [Runella zeae]